MPKPNTLHKRQHQMLLPKQRKTMHHKTKQNKKRVKNHMKGIYQYRDLKTDKIVYIGKDSNIDKEVRRNAHLKRSTYNAQQFNRVLQNNPTRYQYEIIYAGDFDDYLLNTLEINSIAEENPKFNFTKGGEGSIGFKHSEESKRKMSEARKNKKSGFFGKNHTFESRRKMSERKRGKHLSPNTEFKKGENHQNIITFGLRNIGFDFTARRHFCNRRQRR